VFFKSLDVYGSIRYSLDDAINIAEIFATIIDRMSSFTATHSRSVAKIAAFLAEIKGFSADEVKNMKIAGLLHDLGKLAIPNEILEKPGKLNNGEVVIIRQHTYYTYRILEQIDNFDTIAKWAAYHHETLDGQGYPFRIKEESIPLGSKIVAVADIFVALTENRPYRENLSEIKVKSIIFKMAENGKIDKSIVNDLFEHYHEALEIMLDLKAIAI
jgi:putative nucleotidyltransferase with HDIG domain